MPITGATAQTQEDFAKQLLKGKIAEQIFNIMFHNDGRHTIIPFGYEETVNQLRQYASRAQRLDLLDTVRDAPDFAVITISPPEISLVEVKYRNALRAGEIEGIAKKICGKWKFCKLFLATPHGFYLDDCETIVAKHGEIANLSVDYVLKGEQVRYLEMLNTFVPDSLRH